MSRVYVETSIISYLRQRPSTQIIAAARQLLTKYWWEHKSHEYELVISQYVIDEASLGDPVLAEERLLAMQNLPLLELTPDIPQIAAEILRRGVLPIDAKIDALHIAVATFHKVDYLITWNCKHIANARMLPKVRDVLLKLGYSVPTICTPEEMVGDDEN